MDLIKETLLAVSNYPGGYRLIYDLIYENNKNSKVKEQSVRNVLSKMKKRRLISNKSGTWSITSEGKQLLKERKSLIMKFSSPKKINKKLPKTMIVIFDIPEKKRLYRDWLRSELIGFGFELIQKSVWYGPKLPKEFINYLEQRNILKYVRFFKVSEGDLI